jgi:hypothetical protein
MGQFDKMFGAQSQVQEALNPAEPFAAMTLAATTKKRKSF